MSFDADYYAADALGAQREAMAGPLEAAMRVQPLAIGTAGRVTLDANAWEPMIQLSTRRDLGEERLEVQASLVGGGALPGLVFERMSEAGNWLVLHVPPAVVGRRTAAAVEIDLSGRLNGTALNLTQLRALVDVRLVEGLFARLLHVLSAETAQLRRQARLIHQAASPVGARGFMLDRHGQELAVPRLADRLEVQGSAIVTIPAAESDESYRRRLAIFRRFFRADRSAVLASLNGTTTQPGPLQQIGAPASFAVDETDNPLLSGLRIVSVANTAAAANTQLANFFDYLRATILIDPVVAVPASRALPVQARQDQNALRTRLRTRLTFADPAKRAMAPYLAIAFDRLTGFLAALGIAGTINIFRAQDNAGGNRHELGLGAEIGALGAAMLNPVRTALAGTLPVGLGKAERSIAAALKGVDLTPTDGAWLLKACGFRTVETVTASKLFVSHLSMGGLTVTGPGTATVTTAGAGISYSAAIDSGISGIGMALAHALSGGDGGWPTGDPPWALVPMAQLNTTLDGLAVLGAPLAAAIVHSRVAAVPAADIARFVEATKRYPTGTVAALKLDPAFATALTAANAAAVARWERVVEALGANGAASAALFVGAGGSTILLASSHGLPLVGSNIGPRRSTGYFWDCVPASGGADGSISPSGTASVLRARAPGIYAVHCLASARIGETDPFEYRVELPAGATIDLGQYEMLMNILMRCYPVGIEINTWSLRRSHVQLAGVVTPLSPNQSRSFRRWQHPHFAGVELDRPASATS
jgi:hypothetical protein